MIELINIIIQIIYIYFLTLFPLNKEHLSKSKNYISISYLDIATANLTLHMLILLCISFFSVKYIHIFYFQIIFGLWYSLKLILSKKNFSLNKNYFLQFSLFFTITFILSIDVATNLTLGWDSQFRWIIKALNFYQGNSISNLVNFTGPEYPHFGSYLWGFFWKVSILDYEYAGRIFYLALFTISILSFCEIFEFNKFRCMIVSLLIIIIAYKYIYFNGYQDIIIFSLLIFISKNLYLVLYKKIHHKIYYVLIMSNLVLVSWIKTEGFLYSIFILIALFFFNKSKKLMIFQFLFLIFIILTKFLVYQIFDFPITLQGETYNKQIFDFDFKILIDRFQIVTKFYIIFLFNNLLMLFSLISLIFLAFNNFKIPIVKFLILFYILNLSFIYTSHLFMNIENIDYWITHTIPRFMIQTTGIYILSIVLIFNITLKNNK